MPAHGQWRDNAGAQTGKIAARLIGGVTRKYTLFAGLDHVECGLEHNRGAGGTLCRILAPTCQHLFAVGKADGRRDGLGQDDFGSTQCRFGRKAARRVGEYFRCNGECTVGCTRCEVVGDHKDIREKEAQHDQAGNNDNARNGIGIIG